MLDFDIPSSGTVYYVAAHCSGADSQTADGSLTKPFASMHQAVAAVRASRAGKEVITEADQATIVLHGGKHYLRETLNLGPRVSGVKLCYCCCRASYGTVTQIIQLFRPLYLFAFSCRRIRI